MKTKMQKTVIVEMSEKESEKLLMMLNNISSGHYDMPGWVYKITSELAESLEGAGVEE